MNAFVKPIIICEPVILQLNHLFFYIVSAIS